MDRHPTGTVTFLFTDIEGSTKLAREHPHNWDAAQRRHHQILRAAIESEGGYVFQVIGDAFCAAFHRAGDALRAAYQAQRAFQSEAWGQVPVRVRMGIHTGEAEARGDEYRGYLALSLVQRLMSAGHGGQVLVSGPAENLLRGQLPDELLLRDLGRHPLRDVPQPIRVFQLLAPDLPSEFPPLRNIPSHPNNLPNPLTSFVGRETELADIEKLLLSTHLLTLIGPGGTGKTRLSVQVASALLDRFPDGLWFVELAPVLDPLLVPRVTAMTMGLRDEPLRPVIDMLCDYLREKKMLLILDNCEHLVDACARMADRILQAARDVRILASSREALGIGGEVTYRVPSLGLPDIGHLPTLDSLSQYEAVRLFIDRARSAAPSFAVTNENAPAVAQICHRLDGIPLAIELAAAKIRVLGVEQIAKRLDDRFRLLTGGSRTALERHQTLRAAIDWSYNLLPEIEQILFRRLSIFVNGWTLEAAESICGSSKNNVEVFELLEQLINKSLVLMETPQSQTRYSMLETMRQYAGEKLLEAGESDQLHDRHMSYFLELAEAAEPHLLRPEQLEWLAKLDADYENIRLALGWALNKESAEPSLRLCAALGWFWTVRGHWMEGARWLKTALSKPDPFSERADVYRVRALYQDAALANWLDDLERMKSSAERSLALAEKVSVRRDIAISRFYLGWALDRQRDYDRAIPFMEQSLKDFQGMNDLYWESITYRWLTMRFFAQGKILEEERVNHHLELARRAGEKKNLGEALLARAFYLFRHNHQGEAIENAEEAEVLFKQMGLKFTETGHFFETVAWLRGDYEGARSILMEMKERFEGLGDRNVRSLVLADLGMLALEEEKLHDAHIYLVEALAIARELNHEDAIVERLADLGTAFYLQGNMTEFRKMFKESFLLAKQIRTLTKRSPLVSILYPLHDQIPEILAQIEGALYRSEQETGKPIHPLWKRYYDRAEVYARRVLGNTMFDSLFMEGQKLSLDQAIDLLLKTIEDM